MKRWHHHKEMPMGGGHYAKRGPGKEGNSLIDERTVTGVENKWGVMWPSDLPLGAPDTNPRVKNSNKRHLAMPLSHSTPKDKTKGSSHNHLSKMILITPIQAQKNVSPLLGRHLKVHSYKCSVTLTFVVRCRLHYWRVMSTMWPSLMTSLRRPKSTFWRDGIQSIGYTDSDPGR